MSDQFNLFGEALPPPEPRRALFDVDYTPPPVAGQIIDRVTWGWLVPDVERGDQELHKPKILGLGSGAGVWEMELRKRFSQAHITAVEIREEERPHLECWCDEVIIGDIEIVEPELGQYDLVIGNIPFSLPDARKKPNKDGTPKKSRLRAFELFVVAMRERHLADTLRSRIALYVPSAWWQRSKAAALLARDHQPCQQMNVPLGVGHRGPGRHADKLSYAAYTWTHAKGPTCHGWHAFDLPPLDAEERKWLVVPGTEIQVAADR